MKFRENIPGHLLMALAVLWLGTSVPASAQSFETQVLEELNAMRANPARYARKLEAYRDRFDGRIVRGRGDEADMTTREGPAAVDEAIAALRRSAPLPLMASDRVLSHSAADHVAAQRRSGEVGHYSNGEAPGDRVVKRGGGRYVGEVITYGHSSPESVIWQLLVDDGVPQRGHRKTLLSAEYRFAGVACGRHPEWRTICVIDLASNAHGMPPLRPKRR